MNYTTMKYAARAAQVMQQDEELVLAGSAQWVQFAERMGRGQGEGILCVTRDRLFHLLDVGNQQSISIPLRDITKSWQTFIITPFASELHVQCTLDGASQQTTVSFYAGKRFCRDVVAMISPGGRRNEITVVGTIQEWLLDGEEVLLAERAEQIGVLDGKRFVSSGSVALTGFRFWYEDDVLRDRGRQFGMGSTEHCWYEDITACDPKPTGSAWTLTLKVGQRSDEYIVSEAFATKFSQLSAQRKQAGTTPVDKYRMAMAALAVEAREGAGAMGDLEAQIFYDWFLVGLAEFRNYPRPSMPLEGSRPTDRGRQQAWALMSAVKRNAGMGIDLPAVVLPEFSEQDRQFAPGWIEVLGTTTSWEGVFDSYDALIFRANKGPTPGPGRLPWSHVNWVRLAPMSSLSPDVAEARSPILARSIDGRVLYGALTDPKAPGTEMFGLVGTAARSADDWLEIFRTAGVKIRT
jgi:hypothetical protein